LRRVGIFGWTKEEWSSAIGDLGERNWSSVSGELGECQVNEKREVFRKTILGSESSLCGAQKEGEKERLSNE